MTKTIAIIQARMGSTRLPGKVLLELGDKLVIDHVVERVLKSKYIDDVIVATSIDKNNLPLVVHCAQKGYRVFVGSENDVLDRFYQAAKLIEPLNVVRITADCPLIDPDIIDQTIEHYLVTGVDYCNNISGNYLFPDGLDVEVFTFGALKTAWKEATKKSEREHVTSYLRENENISKSFISADNDYASIRITLDEEKDYKVIKRILEILLIIGKREFKLKDIVEVFKKHPEISIINQDITRNEGYIKSIKND